MCKTYSLYFQCSCFSYGSGSALHPAYGLFIGFRLSGVFGFFSHVTHDGFGMIFAGDFVGGCCHGWGQKMHTKLEVSQPQSHASHADLTNVRGKQILDS